MPAAQTAEQNVAMVHGLRNVKLKKSVLYKTKKSCFVKVLFYKSVPYITKDLFEQNTFLPDGSTVGVFTKQKSLHIMCRIS